MYRFLARDNLLPNKPIAVKGQIQKRTVSMEFSRLMYIDANNDNCSQDSIILDQKESQNGGEPTSVERRVRVRVMYLFQPQF